MRRDSLTDYTYLLLTYLHVLNPSECRGNYSTIEQCEVAIPSMGGLLHLVQRRGDWAGCGPAQSPPRFTKCNSNLCNLRNFILFDRTIIASELGRVKYM